MTDAKRLLADSRRDLWRKCVEDHANEDWGTTCDACLYLPEVYARMEVLEVALDRLLVASRAALARLRDEVPA